MFSKSPKNQIKKALLKGTLPVNSRSILAVTAINQSRPLSEKLAYTFASLNRNQRQSTLCTLGCNCNNCQLLRTERSLLLTKPYMLGYSQQLHTFNLRPILGFAGGCVVDINTNSRKQDIPLSRHSPQKKKRLGQIKCTIAGNLNSLLYLWTPEEKKNGRRLVKSSA